MICASEQSVIVDREIKDEFERLMREAGCYFLTADETEKLKGSMFIEEKGCALNADIVGKSPYNIAKRAGIEIPIETKVLVLKENGVGVSYPFSKEKLSPVLAYYIVNGRDEGIELAEKLIEFGGLGHSAVIHSEDEETILKFSEVVKAGRILNHCIFTLLFATFFTLIKLTDDTLAVVEFPPKVPHPSVSDGIFVL